MNIIMVSYCRPNDLDLSIKSILTNTDKPFKLTIIDNSIGKVDHILNKYKQYGYITIIKNEKNIGKAHSFHKHIDTILHGDTNDLFVSIDGDVIVPHNWLGTMISQRRAIDVPFGILAPIYMNNIADTADVQLSRNKLTMHNNATMTKFKDQIYQNRHTAGPLFLLDRQFYHKVGGYDLCSFYGKDDGLLCKAAHDSGLFVGFTTAVSVIHSRIDEDEGYISWKREAIKKVGHQDGYWI